MLTIQKIQSSPCFTSDIPDALQINADYDSVAVDVLCEKKPIFSTTLYTYNTKATFTNFREIIEEYMRENDITATLFSINVQAGQEQTETRATFIYNSIKLETNVLTFLKTNFLTTRTSYLIPYNGEPYLSWYQEETLDDNECFTDLVIRTGKEIKTYRLQDRADDSVMQTEIFIPDQMLDALEDQTPSFSRSNGEDLLSFTVHRGKRSMTFYITKRQPQETFIFRNCFNCLETAHVFAATTLKTDIDRSEATCNNQTTFYDQQTTHAHEVNITTLSLEHALWLNQLLESHKVTDRKGNAILISDITSEISDATNANNKLKFTWRLSDNSLSLETPTPDKIFTEQYNPQFS